MKSYFFLSDIHLRDLKDERAQKLLRFFISLDEKESASEVFFVGDIFDLWLADHQYFINRYFDLVEQIKKFIVRGGSLHYFEGNHDLHLKKFWQEKLGAKVYSDPYEFVIDGIKLRIEHGDQMDPEDRGYHFLRRLLRTSLIKFLIFSLPGVVVSRIGDWMSHQSRSYTNLLRNPDRIKSLIHAHAVKQCDKEQFDILITGHVHLRDEYEFVCGGKKRISYNLGSWDKQELALCFKEQKWEWIEL